MGPYQVNGVATIFKWLPCFQWEQNRKRHRSVHANAWYKRALNSFSRSIEIVEFTCWMCWGSKLTVEEERAIQMDFFVYTRFYYTVEEEQQFRRICLFTLDSTTRRKSAQFRRICLFTLDSTTRWRKSMQFRWICLFTLDSTTRWRKSSNSDGFVCLH